MSGPERTLEPGGRLTLANLRDVADGTVAVTPYSSTRATAT